MMQSNGDNDGVVTNRTIEGRCDTFVAVETNLNDDINKIWKYHKHLTTIDAKKQTLPT